MVEFQVRKTVIGLARDLRGIAFAFNTKTSYMMLFEWIYPQYTPVLQRAVEIWYNDPQVNYLDKTTCYVHLNHVVST